MARLSRFRGRRAGAVIRRRLAALWHPSSERGPSMHPPACAPRRRAALGATMLFLSLGLLAAAMATAGPLRDRMRARAAAQAQGEDGAEERTPLDPSTLPAGIRLIRDVAYGSDPHQRFDVYAPADAHGAPVIFIVHGGGWARGDKTMRTVVENKVRRWVPMGFVVISTDYRMLPGQEPLAQADDVARALAAAQARAGEWGGDARRFILMGHSAGAHLVSLLAAAPSLASAQGAKPWLGTVALDSAAYDVRAIMRERHFPLYDRAFGTDPAYWASASPLLRLESPGEPFLAVCSTRRKTSCAQADAFVGKAHGLGMRAEVLGEDLSHKEINDRLGADAAYTRSVEAFLRGLDPAVAQRLPAV